MKLFVHTPLDDTVDHFVRQRCIGLVVTGDSLKDFPLKAPVFQHLAGRLHEVTGDIGTVKPSILSATEQAVPGMSLSVQSLHMTSRI